MTIFVELTTSPLDQQFQQARRGQQGGKGGAQRAGRSVARRPLRGLEIKDDTYATLKVIKANGEELPLVDSGSPDGSTSTGYSNFLLQAVNETRMEKHQIIETFGASYVFFFGEQPRFLDVSAILLNTADFNWEAEWWANYNTYLRGTKLVEMGARCYLAYDDSVVEGYLMQAQASKTGDQYAIASLQFRFFVTNCFNVSSVGDPNFPIRASVQLPANVSLTSGDAGRQLVSNMMGEPFMAAQANAINSEGRSAAALASLGVPGAARMISQVIRDAPPSLGVSADWWNTIQSGLLHNGNELQNMVLRAGRAIRSLISDNTDEYVGFGGGYGNKMRNVDLDAPEYLFTEGDTPNPAMGTLNPARDAVEADDLFRTATEFLSCFGAGINSPAAYRSLGIAPNFSTGMAAGASFAPMVSGSFGFGAAVGVGIGAVAGGGFGVGAITQTNTGVSKSPYAPGYANTPYQVDSLGVVYGRRSTTDPRFSAQRQKLIQTGFDYTYGYESDFVAGPGFGRAGWGDYGGQGFGSALAYGDPGYKNPNRFTFAGVADNASAFERFTRIRYDRTALTPGPVVGRGELGGGASMLVGGAVSAFAVVGVAGFIDPFGQAQMTPEAMSYRQQQTKFGFGLANPFGVSCPTPSLSLTAGAVAGVGAVASPVYGQQYPPGSQVSPGVGYVAGATAGVAATPKGAKAFGGTYSIGF